MFIRQPAGKNKVLTDTAVLRQGQHWLRPKFKGRARITARKRLAEHTAHWPPVGSARIGCEHQNHRGKVPSQQTDMPGGKLCTETNHLARIVYRDSARSGLDVPKSWCDPPMKVFLHQDHDGLWLLASQPGMVTVVQKQKLRSRYSRCGKPTWQQPRKKMQIKIKKHQVLWIPGWKSDRVDSVTKQPHQWPTILLAHFYTVISEMHP